MLCKQFTVSRPILIQIPNWVFMGSCTINGHCSDNRHHFNFFTAS
nr:MAG TPA: hypothetical protein [Caudoviricetes sp.]